MTAEDQVAALRHALEIYDRETAFPGLRGVLPPWASWFLAEARAIANTPADEPFLTMSEARRISWECPACGSHRLHYEGGKPAANRARGKKICDACLDSIFAEWRR